MKHASLMPPLALGAAMLGALALTGCGAGNSNNPNVTSATAPPTTSPALSQVVYVSDDGNNSLEAYRLGGTLAQPQVTQIGSSVSVNAVPGNIAMDPTGRFLFSARNGDGQSLSVYALNSDGSIATPALGTINLAGVQGNNQAIAIAAPAGAPSGTEYVYVATGHVASVNAFSFNAATGAFQFLSTSVASNDIPFSLAADPTGSYLYSGGASGEPDVTPYAINPANGNLTALTEQRAGTTGPVLVANDPAGPYVYSFDAGIDYLYAYAKNSDGSLTPGNFPPTHSTGNDLVVAPNGSAVFLSNGTAGTITEATILSNGNLNTPTATTPISGANLIGVAVDATNSYVGTIDSAHKNLLVFPLAGTQLGTPISFALPVSNPVSAVFVPQTSVAVAKAKVKSL